MNRLLGLIFFVLLVGAKPYRNPACCEGVRKGTFVSIDEITGKTIIQRNDSLQLEENETLGIKYLEKIRWINNCSYEVYDIDVLKNENSLNIPTEVFIISLEQLNDSVYNQTVLIKKYNYQHTSKITKISSDFTEEFHRLCKLSLSNN